MLAFVNRFGYTEYSEISMELVLDETSLVFKVEDTFRRLAILSSSVQGSFDVTRKLVKGT